MIDIAITKSLLGSEGAMELSVSLSIEEGSFVALTGASGSGKTTLLRILAGLESAEGVIRVDHERWLEDGRAVAAQQRRIGFVFQEYALFSNMSIEENLLYVANDKALAAHLLDMTELSRLKERRPNSLSGGQQQRVALCRAMMNRPKLLLMDEPLSALDLSMRQKLQQEIVQLHKEFNTTTIMVSHDPSEIYRLASRVVVLESGKIVREGSPKEVLLQTSGSQKFAFEGELLEILKADVIFIAVVAIGQQLVEVVISEHEAQHLNIGDHVFVSTKAFAPMIGAD